MEERFREAENAKSKLSQEKSNLKRDIETLEQNAAAASSMLKAMEDKFHEAHSQYEAELKVRVMGNSLHHVSIPCFLEHLRYL